MFNAKEGQDLRAALRKLSSETNKLARTVERIEIKQRWSIYAHPLKFFIFSFMNGLFIALGSTFGVALVLLLFHYLGYIPILGDLSNGALKSLQDASQVIK